MLLCLQTFSCTLDKNFGASLNFNIMSPKIILVVDEGYSGEVVLTWSSKLFHKLTIFPINEKKQNHDVNSSMEAKLFLLVISAYTENGAHFVASGPYFPKKKNSMQFLQHYSSNVIFLVQQPPSWHKFKTFSTFLTSPHVFVYSSSQRLRQNNDNDDIFFSCIKF